MNPAATAESLPQHLRSTYRLIQAAFPQGIDGDAYLPLLALLSQNLADRNLADILALAFGIDYGRALNDLYRARTTAMPSAAALERVKSRLLACGYADWLSEE
jgi:hypothetical protein